MKTFTLKKIDIIAPTGILLAIFILLSINNNHFQFFNFIFFSFLLFVPGILTILALKLKYLTFWGYLSLSIGFSILELMTVVLLGNVILPHFGSVFPLSKTIILVDISVLILGLLTILLFKYEERIVVINLLKNKRDILFSFFPIIFVFLSVIGAVYLNNGGNGWVTYTMLLLIASYVCALIFSRKEVSPSVFPTALFFISLSLLLMTSLRSWYISGHDVLREFQVFQLAKNSGVWDIAFYKDAYNACMSITILPTIFANILKISDAYIYKILFQIIFASVPPTIYLFLRRYASSVVSFLSAFYFISFPTFFNDMPMLNRQEIAFLFLALMIYAIFEKNLSIKIRRGLFMIFGFGMILSHYSTTYSVLALLLFLIVAEELMYWFSKFKKMPISLKFIENKVITWWMVLILIIGSFFWTSIVTDTSSNSFSRVIKETIEAVKTNTKSDSQSTDVMYSFFSWHKPDIKDQFKDYQKDLSGVRQKIGGSFYDQSLYSKYKIALIDDSIMPLTKLGKVFSSIGINVETFNYLLRQISGRLLQLFIVIGLLFVMLKRKWDDRQFAYEFILLSVGSLILLFSIIVLPVLSIEYGLLRAFEQSLMFLGVFVVIGTMSIFSKYSTKKQLILASVFSIIFFLSNTGIITQALGGYDAQLHLNNSGKYYDNYYTHKSEVVSISWLANKINNVSYSNQPEIQVDPAEWNKIIAFSNLHALNDIYPGVIEKSSYVYLAYTNVHKSQASVIINGDGVKYSYPIEFLDENKDLIYNNGDTRIYK